MTKQKLHAPKPTHLEISRYPGCEPWRDHLNDRAWISIDKADKQQLLKLAKKVDSVRCQEHGLKGTEGDPKSGYHGLTCPSWIAYLKLYPANIYNPNVPQLEGYHYSVALNNPEKIAELALQARHDLEEYVDKLYPTSKKPKQDVVISSTAGFKFEPLWLPPLYEQYRGTLDCLENAKPSISCKLELGFVKSMQVILFFFFFSRYIKNT